jgi:hypothetical protein
MRCRADALALVHDDQVWSQLVPCSDGNAELFGILRFHFPLGLDNSGFVGWLAGRLKSKFGTGVFVTCGQNSSRGGIFDYTGCPMDLKDQVFAEIRSLLRNSSEGRVERYDLAGRTFRAIRNSAGGEADEKR